MYTLKKKNKKKSLQFNPLSSKLISKHDCLQHTYFEQLVKYLRIIFTLKLI